MATGSGAARAQGTRSAGLAGRSRKCDLDTGIPGAILGVCDPFDRGLALRAGGLLGLPIDLEVGGVVAGLFLGLPRHVLQFRHRANQFNGGWLGGSDQQVGGQVSRIHIVLLGRETLLRQVGMNGRNDCDILGRGQYRLDLCDDVDLGLRVTAFGEMSAIADPGLVVVAGIPSFQIIR